MSFLTYLKNYAEQKAWETKLIAQAGTKSGGKDVIYGNKKEG